MNKEGKHTLKLTFMFSLAVFMIMSFTLVLMSGFIMLLYRFGLLQLGNPGIPIMFFTIASILIGTVFSRFLGKKIISSIEEISEATKEVAKGKFDIRLDEKDRVDEISNMAHNFNIMTQELGKTEIFRSDFINNVSHEFKTPLSAVEGYATLLQNKSLSEEKRVLYATKIIYNTRRLSSLVGNVLELSKLENHEINIEKEEYSLDEQLREIILMFEGEWSQKELELDVDLDSVDYYGNSDLLGQVWQNLISNAIKFVGYSGKIHIQLRKKPEGIRVAIVDNGIGIDKENQERIFERFYQEDMSHSTAGNGLGLTLSRQIIELHEGEIRLLSEKNKGAEFVIGLPI